MNYLLIAMFFILFDFNITLAGVTFSLLPGSVGYLLLYMAMKQLQTDSPVLEKCKPLSMFLACYSFITFICSVTGLTANPLVSYIIGLFDVLGKLFIAYQLVQGLKELELGRNIQLYSTRLQKYWALIVSFQVFSLLLITTLLLSVLSTIISFIFSILFFLTLNIARFNWNNGTVQSNEGGQ